MAELTPELAELLAARFNSIEQVDAFLLLASTPERRWSPQEVASELDMPPQSASMRLFLLASAGLLLSGETPLRYWYEPMPGLSELVEALARLHASDRAAIVDFLGGGAPTSPARQFADAFRLRKP